MNCVNCGTQRHLAPPSGAPDDGLCAVCFRNFDEWALDKFGLNTTRSDSYGVPPHQALFMSADLARPEVAVAFDEWLSARKSPAPE